MYRCVALPANHRGVYPRLPACKVKTVWNKRSDYFGIILNQHFVDIAGTFLCVWQISILGIVLPAQQFYYLYFQKLVPSSPIFSSNDRDVFLQHRYLSALPRDKSPQKAVSLTFRRGSFSLLICSFPVYLRSAFPHPHNGSNLLQQLIWTVISIIFAKAVSLILQQSIESSRCRIYLLVGYISFHVADYHKVSVRDRHASVYKNTDWTWL